MEYYAGIDVSLEVSSVCVVDGAGKIVREAKPNFRTGSKNMLLHQCLIGRELV